MEAMVERFRDFINDNDAKKARAQEKARKEHAHLERLEEQEQELIDQREELMREKETREASLERLRRYADFLMSVVSSSDGEFREPVEILSRHETLHNTQSLQEKTAQHGRAEMERLRSEIGEMQTRATNETLRLNSELQRKQHELEDARANEDTMETKQEASETFARKRVVESSQVEMSVLNLYARCFSQAGRPSYMAVTRPASTSDAAAYAEYLIECLEHVRRRVVDLRWITEGFEVWQAKKREEAQRERAAQRAARAEAEAAQRQREELQAIAAARRKELRRQVRTDEDDFDDFDDFDEDEKEEGEESDGFEGGLPAEARRSPFAGGGGGKGTGPLSAVALAGRTGRRSGRLAGKRVRAGSSWLDRSDGGGGGDGGSDSDDNGDDAVPSSMPGKSHRRMSAGGGGGGGVGSRRPSLAESRTSQESGTTAMSRTGVGRGIGRNTFVVSLGLGGDGTSDEAGVADSGWDSMGHRSRRSSLPRRTTGKNPRR